jgi:hypothetical protein
MNDTMSLLLATAILAAGGLGLVMYKSSDDDGKSVSDDYNEDIIFSDEKLENDYDDYDDEFIDYEPKPYRSRGGSKTKRNKKSGGTRRR